ncbi:MAG: MFS transporter [Thermoplasmata archaeon]
MYNKDLHLKNFNLMIINSGLSRFGFSSFDLIIIWVILYLTKMPILSGLGDGILSMPLFFSFVVGAYIDYSNKKKIIAIISGIIRSISITSIFIGLFLNNILIILISIYVSAFLIGFTSDILNSIRSYWMKEFLEESEYKKGVSISNSIYSLAEGIGYITSGIFIDFGSYIAFLSIFIVFTISIIPVIFIKDHVEKKKNSEIRNSILEGIRFIFDNKIIVQIMILAFFINFIFGTAGIIFVALVQLFYKLSAIYVSIIFSALVFGIVFGSSIGSKVKGKIGVIFMISFVMISISMISIYLIKNIFIAMAPSAIIGIIIGILNVALGTATIKIIPQNLMARVQGAFSTFSVAIISFSGLVGGLLIQELGIMNSFILLSLLLILIVPMIILFKDFYEIKI